MLPLLCIVLLDTLSMSPGALAKLVIRTVDLDSIVGMGATQLHCSVCMLAVELELPVCP